MNLRRILIPVAVSLTMLAMVAEARYVFVLPPSGSISPIMVGYNENLQPIGSVSVPAGANQVLTSVTGDKAIIISQNGAAGVSFVNVVGGQLSGAARPLSLDGQIPAAAAILSPDGNRVVVVAGAAPATLYVIDIATETFAANGKTLIGGSPRDLVVSQDSRYAYLLGPGLLTVVELSSGSVITQTGISGQAANSVVNLSLSPTGSVFATSQYLIIEFDGKAPFNEKGRSSTIVHPGKLSFSPDGRYAVTTNELLSGSSVMVLDMQLIGAVPATDPRISVAPITQGGNNVLRAEKVQVINETTALAYVPAVQKIFLLQYPALVVSDINLGGAGVPSSVTGYALSNEFPKVRYLYYNSAGQLYKQDLLANQSLGSVAGGLSGLSYAAVPSAGPAVQMVTYNTGQTVTPNTLIRPYVVRVLDANGRPVFNAPITFSSDTGGVLLTNASTATNLDGYASVTPASPATNGNFVVKAVVGAITTTLTSTVVGGTGGGGGGDGGNPSTSKITLVAGDGQLIQNGFPTNNPLVVKMTAADGTPLAGRTITWTSTPGIQFAAGATSSVTDANGIATITAYPLNDFGVGVAFVTSNITASSEVGSVTFTMVSYPFQIGSFNPKPTIILNKPLQQDKQMTAKLGVKQDGAIQVIVVTSGGVGISPGLPIPGVGLTISTGNTDPKLGPVAHCEGITVLTGADGTASCNLIVEGLTGLTQLTVDVGGATNFPDLRLTVTAGDPGKPIIVQGNNQTGKPGAQLPLALSARISDGFGNLLPGTPVTWEIVTANSVRLFNTINAADSNGLVSTLVQLGPTPGKYDIKLKAAGQETVFSVTVETVATGFAKVSGDGQPVTPINQAFPQPLVVKVSDAQGAAVAGVTVTWTVSGSATLSALTTTTAADGTARVTVTAGSVAGAITVTAATTGLTNLTFSLQSRLPGPSITAASFANWASTEAGVSPGGLVLISGAGLAPSTQGSTNANLLAGKLPYELAGVTVEFQFSGSSAFAPIYRVSNINGGESVLAQVPFEVTGATVNAVVNVSGGTTTVTGIPVRAVSPGVIEDFINGRQAAVVIRSDGLTVTPTTPARRGELVRMYAIGLGQTSPAAQTNRVGVPDQLTLAKITIGIDNKGFPALSSYMAENLIGVYEIVFRIPTDAIVGNDRPLGFLVESGGQSVFANGSVISVSQ
jgi:uncharacterized protein (TIGR03437 family)